MDQLDCQGDVDPLELMEDGATSPFPTTNSSERSEPMFNAPSKAWINAQISNHLNELADELSEKVNRVETKLNEAMELIGTQTTEIRQQETKIMQQEAKISDLIKANDTANKDIASLKQKLPALGSSLNQMMNLHNRGKSQSNPKLTPNQLEAEVEETMIPPCQSPHDPASG